MNPLAVELANTWISDFWAPNHEITWLNVEQERQLWLDDRTVLIGKVDSQGLTPDGDKFFGEWKTKSDRWARRMGEVKAAWRFDPQSLTYGVLLGSESRRFTVRWALKTKPKPTTDFEWYTYSEEELEAWKVQLKRIADQIRAERLSGAVPWLTNYTHCLRYGTKYACPFMDSCHSRRHNEKVGPERAPHTDLEAKVRAGEPPFDNPEIVVLSSSRMGDYLGCPESYRRFWEGDGFSEESEALTVGSDFHAIAAAHIRSLIKVAPTT